MNQSGYAVQLAAHLQQVNQIILDRIAERPIVERVAAPFVTAQAANRPLATLTLLTTQFGQRELTLAYHAAAAIELIYVATRVHETLVDETARRHGTTPRDTGLADDLALMVGDYLFAVASSEMSRTPDRRIIASYSEVVMQFCEAQLHPVAQVALNEQATGAYFQRIGDTHGVLYAAAARAGAICGGLDNTTTDLLAQVGYDLGMAYRIQQDVQMYQTGQTRTGHHRGTISLPCILAAGDGYLPELEQLLSQPVLSAADHHRIVAIVHQSNALSQTTQLIDQYRQQALTRLLPLLPVEASQALQAFVYDLLNE